MKFKSWMEMHVVRPRRKAKKDKSSTPVKTKKNAPEMSVDLTPRQQLDSAGNSPTSPQLPSREPITNLEQDSPVSPSPTHYFHTHDLPPAVAYLSPFRVGARGTCACACFSAGLPTAFPCTCYPSLDDPCAPYDDYRRLHSIRTCLARANQVGSASPRPRSKIRTNPWLSINGGLSSIRSSSSSECGSVSEGDIQAASNATASDTVVSPSSSDGNSLVSVSTDECSDDVSLIVSPEAEESSDTDECETLNELGRFDENYEYDRETDILGDEDDRIYARRDENEIWWDEGGNRTPVAEEPIQFADDVEEVEGAEGGNEEDDDDDNTPKHRSFENSPEDTPSRTRTLGEIRESLEEKVQRLRLERLIVEDKIREAREEERLRREEKIKFQKQLIMHRRQILVRTLQQLKEKLEDQSLRLQDAYSATLQMQLQVRKQLRNNAEAPF